MKQELSTNHETLMRSLAEEHDAIASLIKSRALHYVDIPMHGNIGDLLIMKGTLTFLKRHNIKTRSISAFFNFNEKSPKHGDVILFHGGGNFGDLYPGPQQVREKVVRTRKDCRIIILPQTIHYESESAYNACCKAFSSHPDLHIFTRDVTSYKRAKNMSRNAYLAPDMAHQLWPIKTTTTPTLATHLGIIRTDGESSNQLATNHFDFITDWPQLVGRRERLAENAYRLLRILHLAGIDRPLVNPTSRLWVWWADKLIQEAIDLFSKYDRVTTDRLHGHILACLMGIPNKVIDNSYGKNHNYASQWTMRSDIVQVKQ